MSEPPEQNRTADAIGKLTIAVWALVAVIVLHAGWESMLPLLFSRHILSTLPHELKSGVRIGDQWEGFEEWPLKKKIEAASVIALSKYQKGDKIYRCIITEILKQQPGVDLAWRVGDECEQLNEYPQPNTVYGDGVLIFFTGSPATFKSSYTYNGGRIGGLGDMPLDEFRKMVRETQ